MEREPGDTVVLDRDFRQRHLNRTNAGLLHAYPVLVREIEILAERHQGDVGGVTAQEERPFRTDRAPPDHDKLAVDHLVGVTNRTLAHETATDGLEHVR